MVTVSAAKPLHRLIMLISNKSILLHTALLKSTFFVTLPVTVTILVQKA